ncbi:MAG: site-specific recombinase XerD [Polaribacter sp.]|jgi:site-specific recombinase XerD
MKKIVGIFILWFSMTVFSQEVPFDKNTTVKLTEVDEYPEFMNRKVVDSLKNNRASFNAFMQKEIIKNLDLKTQSSFKSDVKFYFKIRLDKNKKLKVLKSNIKKKKLHEKFLEAIEKIEVEKLAQKDHKEVSLEFMLPFKVKFNGYYIAN